MTHEKKKRAGRGWRLKELNKYPKLKALKAEWNAWLKKEKILCMPVKVLENFILKPESAFSTIKVKHPHGQHNFKKGAKVHEQVFLSDIELTALWMNYFFRGVKQVRKQFYSFKTKKSQILLYLFGMEKRKGYVSLNDLASFFGHAHYEYARKYMNQLIEEGYIVRLEHPGPVPAFFLSSLCIRLLHEAHDLGVRIAEKEAKIPQRAENDKPLSEKRIKSRRARNRALLNQVAQVPTETPGNDHSGATDTAFIETPEL